jgi:uncharacterized protein (DUF1684 family)
MMNRIDAAVHRAEVDRWHARRVAALIGPEGWLSLTGLFWLQQGENTVGSDDACAVVLPKGPREVGSIDLHGQRTVARLEDRAGVTADGHPVRGQIELLTDADPGGPTVLRLGSLSFYVIVREGRIAVRVKDAENPARGRFGHIERYPVDVRWRVEARFEPHPPASIVMAPDVLGTAQTYRNPGLVRFEVEREPCRLEALQEPDEEELFIVFGDATNGTETFGGGRYLYAKPPDERGTVVLDFNRAYNPPCVFTEYATCVLPLPENRLPVAIEAGEKRYGHH